MLGERYLGPSTTDIQWFIYSQREKSVRKIDTHDLSKYHLGPFYSYRPFLFLSME